MSRNPIGWGSLAKPKPYRNTAYMLWIKTMPCLVWKCRGAAEAAHTGPHGLSTKASDFRCIPLCPEHHRGHCGLDVLGPEHFQSMHNVDIKAIVLQLIERWLADGNTL